MDRFLLYRIALGAAGLLLLGLALLLLRNGCRTELLLALLYLAL